MKKHTKVYMDYFGYDPGDFIPCEITGAKAVDISHNDPRGMGGRKSADKIENLMALSRGCHDFLEAYPDKYDWFNQAHLDYMRDRIPFAYRDGAHLDPIFKEIEKYFVNKC